MSKNKIRHTTAYQMDQLVTAKAYKALINFRYEKLNKSFPKFYPDIQDRFSPEIDNVVFMEVKIKILGFLEDYEFPTKQSQISIRQ